MAIMKQIGLSFGRRLGIVEPLSGHYWWSPDDEIV